MINNSENEQNIAQIVHKGMNLVLDGKYNDSILVFDKALEIDPNNLMALNIKGFALDQLGEFKKTIVWYDKALETYYKIKLKK